MRNELFIAIGSTADAYNENFSIDDVEKAINEHYAPSLVHKEFENEERMRGFQDALEFCGDDLGCQAFWVITPDSDKERERLMNLCV